MPHFIRYFTRHESGAMAPEYTLVIAGSVLALILGLVVGSEILSLFNLRFH